MHVLLVLAQPEPASLNGALHAFAAERLRRNGHQVETSDLHAMRWKATLDQDDFPHRLDAERFEPARESAHAYAQGTQLDAVAAEQDKLRRADAVIFQFPLWWFSMPAILKGWVDRVYAYGFGYGVGEHSDRHWGDRYGEGMLAGKRAMLSVTTGGWESHYGARGINGPIDDLLFPIQHGILFYPGFQVLPPFLVYRTGRMDAARFSAILDAYGRRLDALFETSPIPYRAQNAGDYEIPELVLKPHVAPGAQGFSAHIGGATSTQAPLTPPARILLASG
jgi:NAD(P)H dehydrogenase (quinone)